jgi:hypothetical protein
LNWRILLILTLIISLSSAKIALANGEHQNHDQPISNSQEVKNNHDIDSGSDMEEMDMSGKDKNMDMSGSKEGDSMEGMDMEEGGHGHKAVKEKPANQKVLGAFGAVNLSFIVIGVWSKWFRRKDDTGGNSN